MDDKLCCASFSVTADVGLSDSMHYHQCSMMVTQTAGAVKKFRRTPWRFQQTVKRPEASDLGRFVSTITTAHAYIANGTVIIDAVIFGTERMTALCPVDQVFPLTRDSSISMESAEELHAVLVAAFMDGPDFIFIPTPK